MNYQAFKDNLFAVVREQQIKLGYTGNAVWLYYPLRSLNLLLETALDAPGMQLQLEDFVRSDINPFGEISISHTADRFTLGLTPEAARLIHETLPEEPFLRELIDAVSAHGKTIDEVVWVFRKYSDCVHAEAIDDEEFDYLVYFEDGKPDAFRYCLADEMGHVVYHRFTEVEYRDRGFIEA